MCHYERSEWNAFYWWEGTNERNDMTKFEKMKTSIDKIIRKEFEKSGKFDSPTWFMESSKEEKFMGVTPFTNEAEKAMTIVAVKELIKERNICRYIFVAEAESTVNDTIHGSIIVAGEDRDTGEEFAQLLRIDRTSEKPTLSDLATLGLVPEEFTHMFQGHRTVH